MGNSATGPIPASAPSRARLEDLADEYAYLCRIDIAFPLHREARWGLSKFYWDTVKMGDKLSRLGKRAVASQQQTQYGLAGDSAVPRPSLSIFSSSPDTILPSPPPHPVLDVGNRLGLTGDGLLSTAVRTRPQPRSPLSRVWPVGPLPGPTPPRPRASAARLSSP